MANQTVNSGNNSVKNSEHVASDASDQGSHDSDVKGSEQVSLMENQGDPLAGIKYKISDGVINHLPTAYQQKV